MKKKLEPKSDEILKALIQSLVQEATRQNCLVLGFIGDLDNPGMSATFNNIEKRGHELAMMYRLVGDIVDDYAKRGAIQEEVFSVPS